jgi:hypothetical protein
MPSLVLIGLSALELKASTHTHIPKMYPDHGLRFVRNPVSATRHGRDARRRVASVVSHGVS